MRLKVALTVPVLALALTGGTAIGQRPPSVFTPAQGGVPGPAGPGAVPPRDRTKPLTDYAVVIQPEETRTGVVATRYLRVVRPDQNGGFRVTGLPPGRYAATAVETFEQGRQFVPDVQARLKARGRTFSIDEGGTATLDLSLATGVDEPREAGAKQTTHVARRSLATLSPARERARRPDSG